MTNKFNSLSTNLTKWLTVTRLTDSTKNLRVCRYLAYSMSQTVSGFNFYDGWFFFCNEGQEKRNTFWLTIVPKFMLILYVFPGSLACRCLIV